MRSITIAAAFIAAVAAAPALAWSDHPQGRPEFQPTRPTVAVSAYKTNHNFCPAGLQPVMMGGVICCGTPTHPDYSRHPVSRPLYHASVDRGYVAYSKGYTGN